MPAKPLDPLQVTEQIAELEKEPFDVSIYIPCHYDFSQIEHAAPFLDRYGGKVFIYRWHALRDKMRKYYEDSYPDGRVQVFDFSPRNIIKCLLQEKKKVVFILTASMAYPFGQVQKEILEDLKERLPDKIAAVNVIGHCMYGCMSCTGAEHKVPIYFTRYFARKLPYTTQDIRQWYFESPSKFFPSKPQEGQEPVHVLVAPSTGETSLIVQRPIIDLMYKLQHQDRKYRFVFKMHPAVYNPGDYDLTYPPHIEEVRNVKFIFDNFEVTDEWKPSLLPFLETFEVLLCDLHSTVAFMASYFSPKTILAWHNDADYEARRDPEFLKNLNVFQSEPELVRLLEELPQPKGDASFFKEMYGDPDGKEELRYGILAGWPRKCDTSTTKSYDYRGLVADVTSHWYDIILRAIKEDKKGEDETLPDTKNALGLAAEFTFPEENGRTNLDLACHQLPQSPLLGDKSKTLRVMSLNLWHGGDSGKATPSDIAKVVLDNHIDIVALQEVDGNPTATTDTRVDRSKEVATVLGPDWHLLQQGVPIPHPGCIHFSSILSRYPFQRVASTKFGATINFDLGSSSVPIQILNTHLPYTPYEPYQLLKIPYGEQPFLDSATDAEESSKKTRGHHVRELQKTMEELTDESKKSVILLCGDFNEPSHLDWTPKSTLSGYQPLPVQWPCTKSFSGNEKYPLVDAYRAVHPDPVTHPGFTWCTLTDELSTTDHHDRIDFIFVGGGGIVCDAHGRRQGSVGWKVRHAAMIGSNDDKARKDDVVVPNWFSDHRGVIADIEVWYSEAASEVNGLL
ncbi:Endonuclease/exonuclease/phosphatase [Gaertneriomyces semiglobifer]|nr:Endonuclease/exonuclease/phosphatase [Gaertneriomyces semiglobifer]